MFYLLRGDTHTNLLKPIRLSGWGGIWACPPPRAVCSGQAERGIGWLGTIMMRNYMVEYERERDSESGSFPIERYGFEEQADMGGLLAIWGHGVVQS